MLNHCIEACGYELISTIAIFSPNTSEYIMYLISGEAWARVRPRARGLVLVPEAIYL
jgi:hypothetical protein